MIGVAHAFLKGCKLNWPSIFIFSVQVVSAAEVAHTTLIHSWNRVINVLRNIDKKETEKKTSYRTPSDKYFAENLNMSKPCDERNYNCIRWASNYCFSFRNRNMFISKVRTNWRRLWCDFEDNFLSDIIESGYYVVLLFLLLLLLLLSGLLLLSACRIQLGLCSSGMQQTAVVLELSYRRRRCRYCSVPLAARCPECTKVNSIRSRVFRLWLGCFTWLSLTKCCSYDWISAHTNRTCVSRAQLW